MKKSITKTMLIVMIAMVSIMMVAQIARAATGIATTKHDLSAVTGSGETEICVFCHTPHFGGTGAPLWNRNNTATYTMYTNSTSSTMDMLNVNGTTPGGVSAACLSCHDGAQAYDALINRPGSTLAGTGTPGTLKMTGASTMLLDGSASLTNDHPISIIYNNAAGVGGDAAFQPLDITGTRGKITSTAGTVYFFGTGKNQMECASCHDVHNGAGISPFLRFANTSSQLCLTCHIK
ncbi:MAG: cytochrome c3 family protein [Syntrophales bacterium]